MRALIVPEMRKRWPGARIVHELPTRYSSNRIDLAAILPDQIVAVEIKSSRDVADRLEAQIRAFIPVTSQIIVALAPVWNEPLPVERIERRGSTLFRPRYTEPQAIIQRIGRPSIGIWTVDAVAGLIRETDPVYVTRHAPWAAEMLDMLWVAELREIALRHCIAIGRSASHADCVAECCAMMTGREVVTAVCAALRERNAFGNGSDSPMLRDVA